MTDKKLPNYNYKHRRNILNETNITKGKIEPGTIVRFNYSGKDATERRPLVLVLNEDYEGKLHGLALRILDEKALGKLASMVKFTLSQKIARVSKIRFPKLKVDITSPYNFYHKRLKKFLKRNVQESAYRTYFLTGITRITIIDYRFKDLDRRTQLQLAREMKG